jgi:hypothetical protein
MTSINRLLELSGIAKGPTIADATEASGHINRATANKMVDPRGYFKSKSFYGKSVKEFSFLQTLSRNSKTRPLTE